MYIPFDRNYTLTREELHWELLLSRTLSELYFVSDSKISKYLVNGSIREAAAYIKRHSMRSLNHLV